MHQHQNCRGWFSSGSLSLFNRPVINSFIHYYLLFIINDINSAGDDLVQISSKHLHSRRSLGLEILRECSPPSTCQISHVTCHASNVTCHVSCGLCSFCGCLVLKPLINPKPAQKGTWIFSSSNSLP